MSLWTGPVLDNVQSPTLHAAEGSWLTERLLAAAEERFALELDLGHHASIIGELKTATTAHPLSERLREQLILALHLSGRTAEALTEFQDAAQLLRAELGVEPSATLRTLHQKILEGGAFEAGQPVATADMWRPVAQLPPEARLVGREQEVRRLAQRLRDRTTVPVIVVTGPPGVGKSALAVAVAHSLRAEFPDGQLFVQLRHGVQPVRDPSEVLAELLGATGSDLIPDSLEARAAAFRSRLADRRVLVVLDEAECAAQIGPLIPGTPGCAVLVTSSTLLTGAGSAEAVRLEPLGPEAAVEVLAQAAGDGRIATDQPAAQAISEACDRLPLALRIAGAKLARDAGLNPADLAARLSNRRRVLRELTAGNWSVRSGIESAYRRLDRSARTAFRRIALLCHSGVTAWALGALDDGSDPASQIEALLETNLIQLVGRDDVGQACYRPNGLVAAFAVEMAEASNNETNDALARLLAALTDRAAIAYHSLPLSPDAWLFASRRLITDAVLQGSAAGYHAECALLVDYAAPILVRRNALDLARRLRTMVRDAAWTAGNQLIARQQQQGLHMLDLSARNWS